MPIIREDFSNSKLHQALIPTTVNANVDNIAAIDLTSFDSALVIVSVGATGDELNNERTITVKLHDSDDNETFTPAVNKALVPYMGVDGAGEIAKLQEAHAEGISFMCSYIGHKRYIKPVITVTGEHENGTIIAVSVLLRGTKYLPVNNEQAA